MTITRTIRPVNKAPTVQQEPTTETLESDNYTDDDTLKKANEIGPYTTDDKTALQDRIEHRREREQVNKTNERERKKIKEIVERDLGQRSS